MGQQDIFNKSSQLIDCVAAEISYKRREALYRVLSVKRCLLAVAKGCPDMKMRFQNVSPDPNFYKAHASTRKIFIRIYTAENSLHWYALTRKESNSITRTAQLVILVRDSSSSFHGHENVDSLCSLKNITTDQDTFLKIRGPLDSVETGLKKLTMTTDGVKNIYDSYDGRTRANVRGNYAHEV